jgi:hypothetical protein
MEVRAVGDMNGSSRCFLCDHHHETSVETVATTPATTPTVLRRLLRLRLLRSTNLDETWPFRVPISLEPLLFQKLLSHQRLLLAIAAAFVAERLAAATTLSSDSPTIRIVLDLST